MHGEKVSHETKVSHERPLFWQFKNNECRIEYGENLNKKGIKFNDESSSCKSWSI